MVIVVIRQQDKDLRGDEDRTAQETVFQDFEKYEDDEEPHEDHIELVRSRSDIARIAHASELYHDTACEVINRLQLAQEANSMERDALRNVVQVHHERFYGCLSLPFSLAFFGFFALSAYLHEDITNVYMIESGLRKVLGQNLEKVDDIPGWWKWIRFDTLVPELFDQTGARGAGSMATKTGTLKTFWSRVLVYNQLQGPLVMQQSRSEKKQCVDAMIGDMTCYPASTRSKVAFGRDSNFVMPVAVPKPGEYSGGNVTLKQRQAYYDYSFHPASERTWKAAARRLRPMRMEYMSYLPAGSAGDDDAFTVFIYPNTPRQQINEHLKYLYEKGWLDMQTKEITLKALLLNAEVGRPRLEQFQVIFKFSRGGGVFARLTLESLFLEFAADNFSLLIDALFLMCLMFITGLEGTSIWKAIRRKACRKVCSKAWNILQCAIIFFGWIIVLCYMNQSRLLSDVVAKLKAVVATSKADIPADTNDLGPELFQATDEMVSFTSWFRILLADYHLILMVRFFAAFHAQPRLGVVTSTLQACVEDIIHFLVVLLPTFMAYAISGSFIFGRRMESFATFDAAIGYCFKMMMEGEYDWPELSTMHYWTAALWTWSFMLLMVLLMLNMVLAIVMDVYTEMRKNAGSSETVFVTLYNIVGRVWNWRRWVSSDDLQVKLANMNATITRQDMIEEFPTMSDRQLNALIRACKTETHESYDADHHKTMRMTMAAKLGVDQIHEEIDQLYEAYDEAAHPKNGDHVPTIDRTDPVQGYLHHISKQMAAQNHFMLTAQWQLQQLHWKWQAIEAMHGQDVRFDNFSPVEHDDWGADDPL